MDPITHTFVGASLAAAGLERRTPLATAALVIGANAPDIDGCAYFAGGYTALALRRGWTHGVLALLVLPLLVAGGLLAWDRWVRRHRRPGAAPARAGPLLAVAALGVATHPLLDWLNSYGLRWLMPFDGRWFYGDALFIVDPWIWLLLGAVLYLKYSRHPVSLLAWAAFWLLGAALMLTVPAVPTLARALWVAGVIAVVSLRAAGVAAPVRRRGIERAMRVAIGAVCVYACTLVAADLVARSAVRAQLAARGIAPISDVMVAPVPANPFAGQVVAATDTDYYFGRWNWLARPALTVGSQHVQRLRNGPLLAAAARSPDARRFLTWSRFPYVDVQSNAAGRYLVRFHDARYPQATAGPLSGPTVRLCSTRAGLARC